MNDTEERFIRWRDGLPPKEGLTGGGLIIHKDMFPKDICNCASHCPESGYHDKSCCDKTMCNCWCHKNLECHKCIGYKLEISKISRELEEANKGNEGLNRMLRESQAGQGSIDCYVAQCETIDSLTEVFELAKDYIEGMHDYHLHADFETVRVPIARDKREKLAAAIERAEGNAK